MSAPILRIALPTPIRRHFDYLAPQGIDCKVLIPGVRVWVPFQSRKLLGVLLAVINQTDIPLHKLKEALAILDVDPLFAKDVYQLCEWAGAYYHYALGEVFMNALPVALRKGKPFICEPLPKIKSVTGTSFIPELNFEQARAVARITAKEQFEVFLLDGVTGSGKTEVYLRVIEKVLAEGKQILVLVPEISLTPQTIDRFQKRFAVPIVALHSNLSNKKRLQGWLAARNGDAKIVIGTRSAIFTPFAHLGMIIVDEEHDTSFKQQDRFRYHGRDLAIVRANINNIPIVLGSATPSLESIANAKRDRYQYLSLPERAGGANLPQYRIIDVRGQYLEEGLSQLLLAAIEKHLAQKNQILLFLNKRGFAPVIQCASCNETIECRRCDARMVYHKTKQYLQCHHCDAKIPLPKRCVNCGAESLQLIGIGTQRLEQALSKHFPQVPIIRIDKDSTQKKTALEALLTRIQQEHPAILLGTQMLAKGHHFEDVTLVGIIDADNGLFSADFRATEQMGQLILQVSGRAGRAEKAGEVLIQTRQPQHPLLVLLLEKGYHAFAMQLLAEREQHCLPPYAYFALLRAEAYSQEKAERFLQFLKNTADQTHAVMLGPVSALLAKRKGLFCQHLLIKSNKRSHLNVLLKTLVAKIESLPSKKLVKWTLDVDPVEVI